jgi:TonB family protein
MQQQVAKQVTLVVMVDTTGAVRVTQVLSYSHEALIAAAKQAAERSSFSPPLRNGQPVQAKYTWQLTF